MQHEKLAADRGRKVAEDPNSAVAFAARRNLADVNDVAKLRALAESSKVTSDDAPEGTRDAEWWAYDENQRIDDARRKLAHIESTTVTRPDGTEARCFEVMVGAIERIKERFDRLTRKAKRLNLANPPQIEVVGEAYPKTLEWVDNGGNRIKVPVLVRTVHVWGDEIQIDGWQFVGVVEAIPGSKRNLVHGIGDFVVPFEYREADAHCDHCATNRRRKATYILRNEAGEYKQVGRTCLADFSGIDNAANLAELAGWRAEVDAIMLAAGLGGARYSGDDETDDMLADMQASFHVDQTRFLALSVSVIETEGYRKRGDGASEGTGADIYDALSASFTARLRGQRGIEGPEVKPGAVAKAAEVICWIRDQASNPQCTEYMHNVAAALDDARGVRRKTANVLASAVASYNREMAKRAVDKGPTRNFIEVKPGRREVAGVIASWVVKDTAFGATQKMRLIVDHGNGNAENLWMTAPSALCAAMRNAGNPCGRRVKVRATFRRSDTDPKFGIGSRPTFLGLAD